MHPLIWSRGLSCVMTDIVLESGKLSCHSPGLVQYKLSLCLSLLDALHIKVVNIEHSALFENLVKFVLQNMNCRLNIPRNTYEAQY